jgi:hypothetical protein
MGNPLRTIPLPMVESPFAPFAHDGDRVALADGKRILILVRDRDRIMVALARPRTYRAIVVERDLVPSNAAIVSLAAHENDLLHALVVPTPNANVLVTIQRRGRRRQRPSGLRALPTSLGRRLRALCRRPVQYRLTVQTTH